MANFIEVVSLLTSFTTEIKDTKIIAHINTIPA